MARVSAAEFREKLEKGKALPAILLLGDEVYLRDACRTQLIEKFVPEAARTWAVSRFSADRSETQQALDQCQTLPMLSSKQVVFLEEAEAIEKQGEKARDEGVKALVAYLENPAPFTVFVIEAEKLDMRMMLGKRLALNVSAAIPAVLLDVGYPLAALKGVPLLARTAGLIAHLLEEQQRAIGFVMSHAAAAAIDYDGAAPPDFEPSHE